VVLLVRYVLEKMTEQQILGIDSEAEVANLLAHHLPHDRRGRAARRAGAGALQRGRGTSRREDEEVTSEPDVPGAPR
jgi:hypothetical protein